jgi:hypothetical protein
VRSSLPEAGPVLWPSAVAHDFSNYHYIYWFGPAMGALLAGGYYIFVKYFNYEEANPGQGAINEQEKERGDSMKKATGRNSGKA